MNKGYRLFSKGAVFASVSMLTACMKMGSNILDPSTTLKTCEMATTATQSFYSSSSGCNAAHPSGSGSCVVTVVNFPGVSLSCYTYNGTGTGGTTGGTSTGGTTGTINSGDPLIR